MKRSWNCLAELPLMCRAIWSETPQGSARFRLDSAPAVSTPRFELDRLHFVPVLVVDDNATNRRILKELLESWGMQPLVAESDSAALLQLSLAREQARIVPLVLLDVQMPTRCRPSF